MFMAMKNAHVCLYGMQGGRLRHHMAIMSEVGATWVDMYVALTAPRAKDLQDVTGWIQEGAKKA